MTLLYVICALLGVGLIIFIHEAGHFLAAKKVGVRVERFALGFDPTIGGRRLAFFSFRKGETVYVLGMIPFGGYVKLAGEMLPDPESDAPPKEDELLAKSPGARALVFVAGAVMNILSAFVFFMIAFTIGVPFNASTIGDVVPGGPAWEAGIESGDTVLEIGDRKIIDFTEIMLATALGGGEPVRLTVEKPSGKRHTVAVNPEWSPERGFYQIGVEPAVSPVVQSDPDRGTPAARAGLRGGDRIVGARIEGQELPEVPGSVLISAILQAHTVFPESPLVLEVLRGDETLWVELQPEEIEGEEGDPRVQILGGAGGTVARAIRSGSSAAEILEPGDRIVSVDGRPVASLHWLSLVGNLEEEVKLEIEGADGALRETTVERDDLIEWSLRSEVLWESRGIYAIEVEEDSPLHAAGLREGDLLVRIGDERVTSAEDAEKLLTGITENVELEAIRSGESVTMTLEPIRDERKLGIQWSTFSPIAAVTPGGPADRAGIEPGSRIVSFAGEKVRSFEDFLRLVQDTEVGSRRPVEWIDPRGEQREGEIVMEASRPKKFGLPLGHDLTTVRVGLLESFPLGVQRTVNVAKQVFLTLRSLFRREVSAKNLTGPLGITHVFSEVARSGLARLIYFMAMVSVNLGLINLLPFPILDGGHLLFLGIEKVKGSPVSAKAQELATTVAFFLIIALFLFVTFHDVRRLLFW